MFEWDPKQPLPAQLADAFAVLYDWFEPRHFEDADDEWWGERVMEDDEAPDLIAAVAASSARTPAELHSELERVRGETDVLRQAYRIYRCLYAIDQGVKRQHPLNAGFPSSGLESGLLERYDEFARYNTVATSGYVLPKWTQRYRGTVFAEHFEWLVRARVDRDRICVIGRAGKGRLPRRLGNPKVAVVPFLYSLFDDTHAFAEVDFRALPAKSGAYFTVNHRERKLQLLKDRVKQAVAAIRESEARIAIFPELVLNEPLLVTLRAHLAATHQPNLPLDWVVAGASLPTVPPSRWPNANVACVLSSGGNVVAFPRAHGDGWLEDEWTWTQVKHHRYKLTKKEQERYGIAESFNEARDRLEATQTGRRHFVFDDRSGRYAVLICEDLSQEERTLVELRKLLCRMVIVILMDGPMAVDRWSATRGSDFAAQTGGFVVIANSLLLPNQPSMRLYRKEHKGIPDPYPHGEHPVGLLIESHAAAKFLFARATPDLARPLTLRSNTEEIKYAEKLELEG